MMATLFDSTMQGALPGHQECRYTLRQCHKPVLDGYQFCRTHILEDKNCPFRQCSYVSTKTGRRCIQATLKPHKKDGFYCLQHSVKVNRTRCADVKKQLASTADVTETLLDSLEHYSSTLYNNSRRERKDIYADTASSYLAELASSSDSDVEDKNYTSISLWQPDSDSESIDSESEDIFKYAEVLTAEEATRITRDKLIRLQSLYIEQFKWLQNVLRERRRKYLHSNAASNSENADNSDSELEGVKIAESPEVTLTDDSTYQEYLASRRYHRRHGPEAVMYMRSQERRRAVCDVSAFDGTNHNRYRHSSRHGTKYCSLKSVRCHEKSLPFTRFCLNHVEFDTQQVLFRRCGYEAVRGGLACERIVPSVNENNRCDYHVNVKDMQQPMDIRSSEPNVNVTNNPDDRLSPVSVVSGGGACVHTPTAIPDEPSTFNGSHSSSVLDMNGSHQTIESGGNEMDEGEPEL